MTKSEKDHLFTNYDLPKPKTFFEIFREDPPLSEKIEALDNSPITWQEVDKERLIVLDHLITKSIAMFPSSIPLQDMHYLMQALKAAKVEMDRLRILCHEQGLITTKPPFAS